MTSPAAYRVAISRSSSLVNGRQLAPFAIVQVYYYQIPRT